MEHSKKLYDNFLKVIENKKDEKIADHYIPYALLLHVIETINLPRHFIDDREVTRPKSEYHVLCYIYQQWKQQSNTLLIQPPNKENQSLMIGPIKMADVFSNRHRFEKIFSEIDALNVFERVDF